MRCKWGFLVDLRIKFFFVLFESELVAELLAANSSCQQLPLLAVLFTCASPGSDTVAPSFSDHYANIPNQINNHIFGNMATSLIYFFH